MNKKQGLDLINTLDSRHQSVQPVLRKFVRGEKVSDAEIASLESPFAPLQPILTAIRDGKADANTEADIDGLDTRNAVLQPLLHALAFLSKVQEGFKD